MDQSPLPLAGILFQYQHTIPATTARACSKKRKRWKMQHPKSNSDTASHILIMSEMEQRMNRFFLSSVHFPNDNGIGNALPCVVCVVGLASLAHDNEALFKGSSAIIYIYCRNTRVQFLTLQR